GAALPVLRLLEQGQHGDEVPERVAGLCPAVVVRPVAAGPDHGIDAARPAEDLAQRKGDRAASDVGARLVTVGPGVSRAHVLPPHGGGLERWGLPPVPPASSRRTVASLPSTRRRATTHPADPAPTIT